MPWGRRKHPDDQPVEVVFGEEPCPRCGKMITKNAWGRKAHIRSCLKKTIVYNGKTYPPVKDILI